MKKPSKVPLHLTGPGKPATSPTESVTGYMYLTTKDLLCQYGLGRSACEGRLFFGEDNGF
jgi:hypothetical protein